MGERAKYFGLEPPLRSESESKSDPETNSHPVLSDPRPNSDRKAVFTADELN